MLAVLVSERAQRTVLSTAVVAQLLHVNVFLAAFAGGVTLATVHSEFAVEFRALGAPLAEALKLAALLVFGAKLRLPWLVQAGASGLLFAAIALVAARPIALVFAFIGGPLERKEWLAAAWFGPKGFASLLYALLLLHAGLPRSEFLFRAVALVIVSSIVAHSSTDVVVARVFRGAATGPLATNDRDRTPPTPRGHARRSFAYKQLRSAHASSNGSQLARR